MIFSQHH